MTTQYHDNQKTSVGPRVDTPDRETARVVFTQGVAILLPRSWFTTIGIQQYWVSTINSTH